MNLFQEVLLTFALDSPKNIGYRERGTHCSARRPCGKQMSGAATPETQGRGGTRTRTHGGPDLNRKISVAVCVHHAKDGFHLISSLLLLDYLLLHK
jgi:hypothetical protein